MALIKLVKSDYLHDWFYVEVDGVMFLPCIEGCASEWKEMLCAIAKRKRCSFRRCAVERSAGGLSMWSPRNAYETWDYLQVAPEEIFWLIKSIREVLDEQEHRPRN